MGHLFYHAFKDDATARRCGPKAHRGVDYYVFTGETRIIAGYRELTGAPMYPGSARLFMIRNAIRHRNASSKWPDFKERFADYIVQDWQHWGSDKDGT